MSDSARNLNRFTSEYLFDESISNISDEFAVKHSLACKQMCRCKGIQKWFKYLDIGKRSHDFPELRN